MKLPIISLFTSLLLFIGFNKAYSQKYNVLKSDFSIIEKVNDGSQNKLIMGDVHYDASDKIADFNIKFPEPEVWKFRDTVLYKYINDTLESQLVVGNLEETFIFKSILEFKGSDFGLPDAGFVMENIEETDDGLKVTWSPPEPARPFLTAAYTTVKDNLLVQVVFEDIDGKNINETYYEKYDFVDGTPVPIHISSLYRGKELEKYSILKLKNVKLFE